MLNFILGYFFLLFQNTTHKFWVAYYLLKYRRSMIWRALCHDISKYRWSESKGFAKVVLELRKISYGSDKYKENLETIKDSVKLHYIRNRHHPEYHTNGYLDMTGVDKVEMVADWCAAVRRHADGDIWKSIEHNQKRFGYSDGEKEMIKIFASRMLF